MTFKKTNLIILVLLIIVGKAYSDENHDFATSVNFPGGGVMNKLAVNPSTNVFFCAVWGEGLFKSTNKGVTWTKSDAGITHPFINDILFDKNGEGYVATNGGGVFRSTNQGSNWTSVSVGITNLNVTALAFGPGNLLLAGTGGSGMYVSTDKGATWTNSRIGIQYQDIKTIVTAQNGFVLAGTYGGGIFLSRDTCKTWKANNSGLRNKYINQIIVASNSILYVATNGDGVYQSGNNGTYWTAYDSTNLRDKYITCLCINGQREVIAGTRSRGIYYQDLNQLFKWRMSSRWDEGVLSLACDNSGTVVYTNLENVAYASDDNARTFSQTGGTVLPIPLTWVTAPGPYGLIMVKYTGGPILRSTNYGSTWTAHGRTGTDATSFAFDSSGGIYMGTRNGFEFSSDKGVNWTHLGLSGMEVPDVEYSPSNGVYVSTIKIISTDPPVAEMKIQNSSDLQNWSTIKTSPNENFKKLCVTVTGDLIYQINNTGLGLINNDGQGSWTPISGTVNDFEYVQPEDIWVAGGDKLYYSTNLGATWRNSRIGKPAGVVMNITSVTGTLEGIGYAGFYYYDSLNRERHDVRRSSDFSHWDSLSTGITMGEYRSIDADREGAIYITRNNIMRILNKNSFNPPAWLAPAHMAEGLDSIVAFKWKSARLTQLYEMQLSRSADFDFIDDEVVTSDTLYATALPLELGTRYFARVRSRANDQYGPWSVIEFMTKLGGPILVSPLKNSAGIYYSTDLLWEAVEAADYYRVEVSEKSDFSTLAYSVDSTNKLTVKTSILKPNTVYYWRVKALTKTNSSEWSEVWNFRTTLAAPILVSPAKNSLDHDKTVMLKWRKVDGAPSYDVEVSRTSDFAAPVATKTAVTDSTVTITGLEYNTTYFWRVSAGVTPVVGDWSEVWSFTTGIEPPTLLTPANNAAGLDPAVHFAWDFALTGAYKYEIQIDTATTFLSSPRPVSTKTYDTTGLPRSSKYFWRVRATLGAQKGFWSEAWSFSTKLGAPTLVYPADKSTNLALRIMSKWNQIKAAEFYFVQLAKDTLFTELVYSRDSVYATGFEFKDLEPNTKYFWRVRSANAASPSEWSEIWSFTTGANVPALLKPDDGAADQPVNLTLMWADIMGVPAFHVQVARDEQFANMYREEPEIAGSTLALTDLPKESKFYWRARSVNPSGASPWSEVRSFTTGKGGSAYESNSINARISPNPASSELNAEFEISRPGQARIYILDALGRVALDLGERELATGRVSATFNISVLPSGSYRLIIVSGSDARAVAFIKID